MTYIINFFAIIGLAVCVAFAFDFISMLFLECRYERHMEKRRLNREKAAQVAQQKAR